MPPGDDHTREDLPLTSFLLPNGREVDFEAFMRALDAGGARVRAALNVTTGAVGPLRRHGRSDVMVPIEPILSHVRKRWMETFLDFVRGEEQALYEQLRALLRGACAEQAFADAIRAYGDGWIGAWDQHRHDSLYTVAQERLRALRAFGIEVRERFNPVDDDCPLCQDLARQQDERGGALFP